MYSFLDKKNNTTQNDDIELFEIDNFLYIPYLRDKVS